MTNKNIRASIINTLKVESEAIQNLNDQLDDSIETIVDLLYDSKGRVFVTGVGKSAIIGQKMVATFNSTGTPSSFLHASDAVHGDIGMLTSNDLIICISNSGNTPEIKLLLPYLKKLEIPLIAMVGNPTSFLSQEADFVIRTVVEKEACPNNLAPTASTIAQLAMGDALAIAVLEKRNFSPQDFARLHPGGILGKRLKMIVADVLDETRRPMVRPDSSLKEVIHQITSQRMGATAVVEESGKIFGIITDGDLRRRLEGSTNLADIKASDLAVKQPQSISSKALAQEALNIIKEKSISQLIVIEDNKYLGMIHVHELLREGLV